MASNAALETGSIWPGRLWAKAIESEPPFQEALGVVFGPAPLAVFVFAVLISQATKMPRHLWEPMSDPRRDHRIAAGDLDPRKGIGQSGSALSLLRLLQNSI